MIDFENIELRICAVLAGANLVSTSSSASSPGELRMLEHAARRGLPARRSASPAAHPARRRIAAPIAPPAPPPLPRPVPPTTERPYPHKPEPIRCRD